MDPLDILQSISDEYGLNWNAESMLHIICAYVENQQDNDCFKEFVLTQAEQETQ
tara:strand:+ start:170 stop:331 length:162 start_codon:yes stop_codon:yes gene_type:complete